MKNYIFLCVTVLVYCVLTCPQASAFHPFKTKKLDVVPVISVGEKFDDNTTFAEKDEKSDVITELIGGLKLLYEGKNQRVELTGYSTQQLFARNTEFHNNAQDGKLDYRHEFNPANELHIRDVFTRFEEPSGFEEQLGRTEGRFTRTRNRGTVEFTRVFGKRLSAAGRYGNEFNFFSRKSVQDNFINSGGVDVNFSFRSGSVGSFFYEFLHRRFEEIAENGITKPAVSALVHAAAFGLTYYANKWFFIEALGGADLIRTFSEALIVRPRAEASLNVEKGEKTTFKLAGFELRSKTNAFRTSILESWEVSGGIKHQIFKRVRGVAEGFYGKGEFRGIDVKDEFLGLNVGFEYDLTDKLMAVTGYTFSLRDSSEPRRDLIKNEINFRISYLFD